METCWTPLTSFFVPGTPRPGGSKTATLIRRKGGEIVMKNGRPLITTRDDAKGNKEWKANVAFFARQAYQGEPIARGIPIRLVITFVMPRLASHFRTNGQLKPNAPKWHLVKPDCTKLLRSTEDACTGILWSDDAAIVKPEPEKVYGDKSGAQIEVFIESAAVAQATFAQLEA